MSLRDDLLWSALTEEHRQILLAAAGPRGMTIHSSEGARMQSAREIEREGLVEYLGITGPDRRSHIWKTTISGRILILQHSRPPSETQS